MAKHLNFEKDLPHQSEAVKSVLDIFEDTDISFTGKNYQNPFLIKERELITKNIERLQKNNGFLSVPKKYTKIKAGERVEPLILDIHMETGTGKTYTYAKTMFELNKERGIFKFIVVVPTLSIKAGTVNFLKSEASKKHFRDIYNKQINCLVVESRESKKGKKNSFPQAIKEFIIADSFDKNTMQVLVINQGMINSKTIQEDKYDTTIFDRLNCCVQGIADTNPVVIIDEPHKFKSDKKTWNNLMKFQPQFILRYGATFDDNFYDLIYSLDSVRAFNTDLIKGIIVEVEETDNGKNEKITLKSANAKEAIFTYINDIKQSQEITVGKGEHIHSSLPGLTVEKLQSKKILLSNGYEMTERMSLNPISYSESLQEQMMKKAIIRHFEIEERYMKEYSPRVKPMTLFFIDNIETYRSENKSDEKLRIYFEDTLKSVLKDKISKMEECSYKDYLKYSLANIDKCHGGYFSKDNSDSDEAVAEEIDEILHEKEKLLDIENPRRFIFSKWTLREGWDNPNVFIICKLRGSGSETNKLQEVGRGLRIPVNEFMNRVTDREHYLHYFVDFTEKDFVEKLKGEINNGKIVKNNLERLSEELLKEIAVTYRKEEDEIFDELYAEKIIDRKYNFSETGYEALKNRYPLIFETLKQNKIKNIREKKGTVHIRKEKYELFKKLWEELNSKVIIKYEFKNNEEFQALINKMILEVEFEESGIRTVSHTMEKDIENSKVSFGVQEEIEMDKIVISQLTYREFLLELERRTNIPIQMLNNMFIHLINGKKVDVNNYLNHATIRRIQESYKKYLIENSFTKFSASYEKIDTAIHPTKLTDSKGNIVSEAMSSDFGIFSEEERANENYLYDEIYYDSEIERENIKNSVKEVIVFAKIPKNSIKIPVIGGGSYSPDFAYIIKFEDEKEELNLIIESKGKEELTSDEKMKIESARRLFNNYLGKNINIRFKEQLKNDKINKIIRKILSEV